ncbi:MAG: molybdopterin dinucleotide binding domain-containing protein [bacterium]
MIREVAREFAQAAPSALVHPGWRTAWHKNDVQIRRAIHILNVLAGNWGAPGGIFLKEKIELGTPEHHPQMPSIPRIDEVSKYIWTPEEGLLQNARDNAYFEKPYPIKGWVNIRMNPMLNMPDTNRTIEVFKKLDFALTIDVLLSETALFSDVVLPECTYLERTDPVQASEPYPTPFVALRQQAIKPMFDSKPSWWIFKQLAERLGIGEYFKYRDVTDIINQQVEPLGVDYRWLKANGVFKPKTGFSPYRRGRQLKFNTPSGKIELYSNILKKKGHHPLPVYKANLQPPAGRFRLITSRHSVHSYSMTQNNQWLHEIYPENELWMNPKVAQAKRLRDGDYVWVKSKVGSTKIKLKVTDRIRPDCVYMVMGFGHFSPGLRLAYNKGGSQAALIESAKADITGGSAFHDTFVEVVKA